MSNMNYTQQATNAVNANPSLKDGACLMAVQVTGSCGEATLSRAAMLLEGQTIESDLVKGTTLQWFPKENLRFVNKTVQRINRMFSTKGVAFGKGLTMVPLSIADDIQAEIDAAKVVFDADVNELVNIFDEAIKKHKDDNPDTATLIERYKMDVEQFKGRFIFKSIPPMAVQPLFEDDEDELRGTITQTLFEEVSNEAGKLAKGSFIGKEQCSQKAVSAIKKIKHKLVNLAFLDDGIFKIVESFDSALDALPKTGPVEGGLFHRLANYVQSISNEETIRGIASGEITEALEDEDEVEEDLSLSQTDDEFEAAADELLQQVIENDPNIVQVSITETSAIKTPAVESVNVFDEELDFSGF